MLKLFLSSVFGLVTLCPAVFACSRVTWTGPVSDKSVVITGRSMDWPYGFNSHFHVYPRGEKVDGAGGDNSLSFETLYGSVLLSGSTDIGGPVDAVFDGMNEEGLVANLLYLAENDFGNITDSERPRLSFAAWTLYLLSQFSNVNEVVADVQKDAIQIVPINFGPGGAAHATVHMTVSDASGDSAVIEYLDGKPVVHHGPEYKVMTNSPVYSEQLELDSYWSTKDRTHELPGSIQSPDRFIRGSYYLSQLPPAKDIRSALAGVISVIRNVSVPWGTPDPEHPNISPTWWRTVSDQANLVYYFDSALSPQMVWLNLNELDFDAGTGVRLISVETDFFLQGKLNEKLQNTTAISFLSPSSETDSSGATVSRRTAVVASSAALMMAQTLEL